MFQAMQWLSRFFAAERPVSNVETFNKSSKSLFSFTTDASDISNNPSYNMQHGMIHIFLNTSSKIFWPTNVGQNRISLALLTPILELFC